MCCAWVGSALTQEKKPQSELSLVLKGECDVLCDGTKVATIGQGGLIGEMAFIAEQRTRAAVAPAAATVITRAPGVELVRWKHERLHAYFQSHPEQETAFVSVLSAGLSTKLTLRDRLARRGDWFALPQISFLRELDLGEPG